MTTTGTYTKIGFGLVTSVLTADSAGNLYGTASDGGLGSGLVFKISPNGNGGWTETTLYEFCQLRECADGEYPNGPVAVDGAGNIYGTTIFGGSQNCNSCGVVFRIDPNGNETVIHNFTDGADGAFPQSGLTQDSAGNLSGTTTGGGELACPVYAQGCGVVFKITP
jgi:uncharacterized repeat protein (TIGR03803 family)